jgi:hypothetical protein
MYLEEQKNQEAILKEKKKITQANRLLELQYRKLEYEWEVKLQ